LLVCLIMLSLGRTFILSCGLQFVCLKWGAATHCFTGAIQSNKSVWFTMQYNYVDRGLYTEVYLT